MTHPIVVAKLKGRNIIRENLGAMRSFASGAAHECPDINEEDFFREVAEGFAEGIKTEMAKIFGATKAARMLDPFKYNGKARNNR